MKILKKSLFSKSSVGVLGWYFLVVFTTKLLATDLGQEIQLQSQNEYHGLNHVALIPDGNRRWAKGKSVTVKEGHEAGILKQLPKLVEHLFDKGIHTVTGWCFSTENWNRSKEEVADLMEIFSRMIDKIEELAIKQDVKVVHIGRKELLPLILQQKLTDIEKLTHSKSKHILFLAIDYGGRDEIVRAIKNIIAHNIPAEQITENLISEYLDTHASKYPEPDLIIRTGGRTRMSGFFSWQSSYSELVFLDRYFSDLDTETLDKELEKFKTREKTFGR